MNYAILRTRKLKTAGSLDNLNAHLHRLRPTVKADPDLSWQNETLRGAANVRAAVEGRLKDVGCKVRSNAVLAVEYLMTFSAAFVNLRKQADADRYRLVGEQPADEAKLQRFCAEVVRWLDERHGPANVVQAVLHVDEWTPHVHAVVVPIDGQGKLNYGSFLGGLDKLRQMQTDFAEHLSPLGLVRGVMYGRAPHQDVRQLYGPVQAQLYHTGAQTAA